MGIKFSYVLQRIEWDPEAYDKEYCLMKKKSEVSHGHDVISRQSFVCSREIVLQFTTKISKDV